MTQSVFISYSHRDRDQCALLREGLKQNGIDVHVDEISIAAGSSLHDRIRQLLESCDVTICLVSANSLKSFWVIWEIRDFVEMSPNQKFLPAYLDEEFLQDKFVGDVQRQISERQKMLTAEMKERLENNRSVVDLSAIHANLNSLVNDLPKVVRRLRNICNIDLTPRNFEEGFKEIFSSITGKEGPVDSITMVSSLDNASYATRRREIQDNIARNELQEAAIKTMDLLRQIFKNDDAVRKATRLSGQIRQLIQTRDQESQKHGQLRIEFLKFYNEQIFTYAEELLLLVPTDLSNTA